MWFIARARTHAPRVDTVGKRERGPAPDRSVAHGGSGQGYYHRTALADCDVSLHPDDNRSGTERIRTLR